jgi:hypothetical protein
VDAGSVIASALDHALGDADVLDLDASCEAIAAAELSASCAGQAPDRLPDRVRLWVDTHPHQPHDSEIEQAIEAVSRVRTESELRELWDEAAQGQHNEWLYEVDDLIARFGALWRGRPGGTVAVTSAQESRRRHRPKRGATSSTPRASPSTSIT